MGGFKAAYGAYQLFVHQNGIEPMLPNLKYTPNQLFWIWAAHTACGIRTPERERELYEIDPHPSFNHRINGAFSTFKSFSDDFNCPPNKPMNDPKEICELW